MDFNKGNDLLNKFGRVATQGRFSATEWLQNLSKDDLLFLVMNVRSVLRRSWVVEEIDRRLTGMNIKAVARPITMEKK